MVLTFMNMCDRWKLTKSERVRKWYKSIANLPIEYKTLLKEVGDDTERYTDQINQEKKIIDPILIPVSISGKMVSYHSLINIKMSHSQIKLWTIGDFINVIENYIGKRCLIRECFGLYKFSSIYLNYHGWTLHESYNFSKFIRDGEMPYFYVNYY